MRQFEGREGPIQKRGEFDDRRSAKKNRVSTARCHRICESAAGLLGKIQAGLQEQHGLIRLGNRDARQCPCFSRKSVRNVKPACGHVSEEVIKVYRANIAMEPMEKYETLGGFMDMLRKDWNEFCAAKGNS